MEVFARVAGKEMQRTTRPAGAGGVPCAFLTATLATPAIQLVTLPGSPWKIEAWWPLIADAAALVLMLDSQKPAEPRNREHVLALASAVRCPRLGCVVWTKNDLVTTHALEKSASPIQDLERDLLWRDAPAEHRNRALIAAWPTFTTRFDDQESMLAPVDSLISEL